MPKVEVEGRGTFEVPAGTKLVLAIEDNGVDILHRCGGKAKCTSCRVEVLEGDAGPVSEAEQTALGNKGLSAEQFRLSCQIRVNGDLKVRPAMTVATAGIEAGPRPEA